MMPVTSISQSIEEEDDVAGAGGVAGGVTAGGHLVAGHVKGHESVPTSTVDEMDDEVSATQSIGDDQQPEAGALGVPPAGAGHASQPSEISQHSQLLPDHVDLDHLDDDLDGLFAEFDEDGDGMIDAEELAHQTGCTVERARELIAECDTNDDGLIDPTEFAKLRERLLAEKDNMFD